MGSKALTILKYLLTLIVGIGLLWYLVNSQGPVAKANIAKGFENANYNWIFLTVIIAILEKVVRAYRWNLLLEPTNHKPPFKNTFLALIMGYFANTFAPRMGEVARCYILKKSDDVPVETSFGTVVAERAVDTICLLLLIPIALLLEYSIIMDMLQKAWIQISDLISKSYWIGVAGLVLLAGATSLLLYFRKKIKNNAFFIKIENFVRGLIQSILSIRKIDKKGQFIVCSVAIWVCYFFMTYIAFFALEATSGLSLTAGLIILIGGGMGMAAPVQAGVGAFHYMVSEILMNVYSVSKDWALPYAFLVWGSQTATILVAGFAAWILILMLDKKKNLTLDNANLQENTRSRKPEAIS